MEKIKINGNDTFYEIKSIMSIAENIIRIEFNNEVPEAYGDVTVYTSGGYECSNLTGFATVYKTDGEKIVYLSNDESVYVEPEIPEGPDIPEYVPTIEDVRQSKKMEISNACQKTIYSGVDVKLSDGESHHFSLEVQDQLNLFGKQLQVVQGAENIEYHIDGEPCKYFSNADMKAIIESAMAWVSYNTTYCNSVYTWIDALDDIEDVKAITYGSVVPEGHRSPVLVNYMEAMQK